MTAYAQGIRYEYHIIGTVITHKDERWISNPSDVRTASVKDGEEFNFDFSQYDNDPIYDYEYLK